MNIPVPTLIRTHRSLAGFVADAVVEEQHSDELIITEHPVEQGSVIADHAYKLPSRVVLTYVWSGGGGQNITQSNTFLTDIYAQLLQLQVDRTLFQVFTGKRVYDNMLLKELGVDTDKRTENILHVRAHCQEILLSTTQLVSINGDAAAMLFPSLTAPILNQGTQNLNPAPNFKQP